MSFSPISSLAPNRTHNRIVSLSPVHTVTGKCDCRRKQRENGDSRRIRRQSHCSATVWTGLYAKTTGTGQVHPMV